MFSSTPSMNSSATPFGPQFVFGQSSAPASTSSVTSFGSSTGSSVFGGPSAGVFGASASPLSSTFTTPSAPASGYSSSGFDASMNSSSSPFGPQYVFGQSSHLNGKVPASNSGITSFGSSTGASVFGGPSTGVFGASSSTFTTPSSPAFGWTSTGFVPPSPFGSQYIFGQSGKPNGAEVSAPISGIAPFGSQAGTSVFGGASAGVFGATASLLSSTSTLATTSSPAIWGSSFGFGGGQARSPTFGIIDSEQSTFGGKCGGNRVTSYTGTADVDGAGRLVSISAMHAHKDKCHEELRWEDYMLGDRGTQVRISTCDGIGFRQSAVGGQYGGSKVATYNGILEVNGGSSAESLLSLSAMPVFQNRSHEELRWEDHQLKNRGEFGVGPACVQLNYNPLSRSNNSSQNPISSSIPSSMFSPRMPSFSFPSSEVSKPAFSWPPFSTSSFGNSIWTTSSSKPTCTTVTVPPFGLNSSPSLSGPFSSPTFAPFSLASSVSPTYHSSEYPFTLTPNPFLHQNSPAFTFPAFSTLSPANSFLDKSRGASTSLTQSVPAFGPSTLSSFSSPPTSTAYTSSPSIISSSAPGTTSFGPNLFNYNSTAFALSPSIGSSTFVTASHAERVPDNSTQSLLAPSILPPPPSISSCTVAPGTASRPSPGFSFVEITPSVTQKSCLSAQITSCSSGNPNTFTFPSMIPEFKPSFPTPFQQAQTSQTGEWNLVANFENSSVVKHTSIDVYENGNFSMKVSAPVVDGSLYQNKGGNSDQTSTSKGSAASAEYSHKPDGVHDDHPAPKRDSAIVDEPALKITYSLSSTGFSGGADVMKLMPKLRHTDYYIEPRIEELAVKESSESGFCSNVKDFVVGRLGYGSIKFLGETDVRELDIESHFQFNDREVVVYMDETKKPPVGQGLNKPAEITLSNIKCIDKNSGKQYIDGPKVDKYIETLIKNTAEQGAEFVSYDPVQGDWKFKVQHF